MTQDEIIEMARQAGMIQDGEVWFSPSYENCDVYTVELLFFAKLVAQHEREACAKVCDLALLQCQEAINELDETEHIAQCFVQGAMTQLVKLSKAIRARGQA